MECKKPRFLLGCMHCNYCGWCNNRCHGCIRACWTNCSFGTNTNNTNRRFPNSVNFEFLVKIQKIRLIMSHLVSSFKQVKNQRKQLLLGLIFELYVKI